MPACGLTPRERVRRRSDFERAYLEGTRIRGRFMTLVVISNDGTCARLGVAAGRKLGSAVIRNRVKRLARELFRCHKVEPTLAQSGLDIVIVPRLEMLDAPFAALEADYTRALTKYRTGVVQASQRGGRPRSPGSP